MTIFKQVAQIQLGTDEASAKILGETLSKAFGEKVEPVKLDGISLIQLYPHRDIDTQVLADAGIAARTNTLQPSHKGETYLVAQRAPAPAAM